MCSSDLKCAYCAFYSVRYTPARADAYLAALERELAQRKREYPGFHPDTVYCGGGTPTCLSAPQLRRLLAAARRFVGNPPVREWTIEANPGSVSAAKLRICAAAGVNRVSLGAQALDDAVLARLGRRHTAADIYAAWELLRAAGFANLGLDLIACVPGVTRAQLCATLAAAVALGPRHISVYALTVEEGSRLQQKVSGGAFRPLGEAAQLAALHRAAAVLRRAGLARYEISNYARPGFECAHNVACWRGMDYLGVGPAAASRLGRRHWTNAADVAAYCAVWEQGRAALADEEQLAQETAAADELVFGLRLAEGVDLTRIGRRHGLAGRPLLAAWERRLSALAAQRLTRCRGPRWMLTARGLDLADRIAVELMC